VVTVDCHELTQDEQLALAGELTGGLQGSAVALVNDSRIVFDQLSGRKVDAAEVETLVRAFVSRRKDAKYYAVETQGDTILVRSPDPLARGREGKRPDLPPNVLKCPFCSFVTPYQELYNVHVRSHGFVA
jgi:hypothetical protein